MSEEEMVEIPFDNPIIETVNGPKRACHVLDLSCLSSKPAVPPTRVPRKMSVALTLRFVRMLERKVKRMCSERK